MDMEGASHKGSLQLVLLLQRQLAGQRLLEMAVIRADLHSGDRDQYQISPAVQEFPTRMESGVPRSEWTMLFSTWGAFSTKKMLLKLMSRLPCKG